MILEDLCTGFCHFYRLLQGFALFRMLNTFLPSCFLGCFSLESWHAIFQEPLKRWMQILENNGIYHKMLLDAIQLRVDLGLWAKRGQKPRRRDKSRLARKDPLLLEQTTVMISTLKT